MLQLVGLRKAFADRVLLDDVTWQLNARDRVGLCGPNGAGKTTLLKILARIDEPDAGQVVTPSDLTIGYLPQDGLEYGGRTLVDEARQAFGPLLALKEELHRLEDQLADTTLDDATHEAVLVRYSEGQEDFRRLDGYTMDLRVATVLRGLGFEDERHGEAHRDVLRWVADAHRARQAAAATSRRCCSSTSRPTTSTSTPATGSRST